MAVKLWKYVYVDTITTTVSHGETELTGEPLVGLSTAFCKENTTLTVKIQYITDDGIAFIFSDTKIESLELVANDIEIGESIGTGDLVNILRWQ